MVICCTCLSAIRRLRPLEWHGEQNVCVELPICCREGLCDCWICLKFSKWLEKCHLNLFKQWCGQLLQVKFGTLARTRAEKYQQDMLRTLLMEIKPNGENAKGGCCEIELDFISTIDFLENTLTAPRNHTTPGTDLSVVDHWIGRCVRDHKRCGETSEVWYPSRLLRLGSHGQDVKLIISKENPLTGPYLTLSHRWGDQPYEKLTTSTLVQLQRGIDVASLPQVFQDTIAIASHLGIKHLWIDALCIIQAGDNLSDWEIESQQMDKVYSCAFLNVSASHSHGGSESLLRERSWRSFLYSEIQLEVNGRYQTYYAQDGDIWNDEIVNAPLMKRGWVFQERFLARRVLHFGQHQLGWECSELDALEMFPEGIPLMPMKSPISKSEVTALMESLTRHSDQTSDLKFVTIWHNLVINYSKCKLSYPEDKLIAFAGIPKYLQEAEVDGYAAGMWKKGMIYDLAWWRLTEDRDAFPISATSSRAPSWSWASVDGEIIFPSTSGSVQAHFIETLEFRGLMKNEGAAFPMPESVRIKGHCLPLNIECSDGEIVSLRVPGFHFHVNADSRGSSIDLEIMESELLMLAQRGRALFLPLFGTTYYLYGLVLVKIRGVHAHRRVGAVEIPVVESDLPAEMRAENDRYSRQGRSQPGEWVRVRSSDPSNPENNFWNVAALHLADHLKRQTHARRIIDIY